MSKQDQPDQNRRDFLKKSAATAVATVAPGVVLHTAQATPRNEPVTDKVRWGMMIDTSKCADGCNECVEACNEENGLTAYSMPEGADEATWDQQRPKWIRTVKVQDNLTGLLDGIVQALGDEDHGALGF